MPTAPDETRAQMEARFPDNVVGAIDADDLRAVVDALYDQIEAIGIANGIAALDSSGKVPSAQLNVAPLPNRLGATAEVITNWNSAMDNGWYMAAGATNAPPDAGANWVIGEAVQHNSAWVTQRVWVFTSGVASQQWERRLQSSAWGLWYRIGVLWQGAWSGTANYGPGSVVSYNGRYWLCVQPNTNVAPA